MIVKHHRFGTDEGGGVQKFHSHWVSRLGGVPVYLSFVFTLLIAAWLLDSEINLTTRLLVCTLPAFGIGLIEDITRKAGVLPRLLLTMMAAAIGWWLLDAKLTHLEIAGFDQLLAQSKILIFVLTIIAAGGVAHAINIIDGYNGLSGFFISASFAAIAFVAWRVGDEFILRAAIIASISVAGFLLWNFPFGKIFLGDAGAYFAGFLMAELSILLVHRNPDVSPWFPMLTMVYPVWETLFSIGRRASKGLRHIGQPDALHLHHLVYGRLIKRYVGSQEPKHLILRNSFTSVYLWPLILMSILPAVMFWDSSRTLKFFCLLFIVTYSFMYFRIVRFRVPRWMVAKPLLHRDIDYPPDQKP